MDLEYVKGLLPIHYGVHLGLLLESLDHLVVSDLLIYHFSFRKPTHTREILDPTIKGTLYILLFVQPYIMCSSNSKGQMKGIKMEGMALKLWYTL